MKLTWIIFRKDLARIWFPWLVWVSLVIADMFLGSRMIQGAEVNRATQYEADLYRGAIYALFLILGYILTAWLVQLDCPMDSEAEWMTRPISGPRLFAAKSLGIGLLMWAPPLLLDAVWWLRNGLLPGQMLAMALATLTLCGGITLPSFFFASLSRDWVRFIVITLGVGGFVLLADFAGLNFILFFLANAGGFPTPRFFRPDIAWILFAAFAAATFVQIAYRRIWRASGIAVIGVLLAALASHQFEVPSDISLRVNETKGVPVPADARPLPEGIRVSVEYARLFKDPGDAKSRYARDALRYPLTVGLRVEGTPGGEMFRYQVFDGELELPGRPGIHEQWSSYLYSGNSPANFPSAVLGLKPEPLEFSPHLYLRRSIASLALAGGSSLHGRIYLRRMVSSIDVKLPLVAGSSARIWGSTITLVDTRVSGSDEDLGHTQPWTVVSLINVVGPSYAGWQNGGSAVPALGAFVFWNRSRGEALYALNSAQAWASVQGVHMERQSLTGVIPYGKDCDTREKAETWIAGSELVWVVFEPREYYWTPLEISRFTLSQGIE